MFIAERTLSFPDIEKDYFLSTDACDYSIAGILSQYDYGIEKVITMVSRTLKQAELFYTVSEKELLSLVYCFKKLCTYLYGSKIIF